MQKEKPKQRVIVYIDGYNLYYALKRGNYLNYLWLNLSGFAESMTLPHQKVVVTKYFTSTDTFSPHSRKRQEVFFDALSTLPRIKRYMGHFQKDVDRWCVKCNSFVPDTREKKTDVNIATEMLVDAFTDKFDVAILVSSDGDYVPPIRYILTNFKSKRIFCAIPEWRNSKALRGASSDIIPITEAMLAKCQLPDEIHNPKHPEFTIKRPSEWV